MPPHREMMNDRVAAWSRPLHFNSIARNVNLCKFHCFNFFQNGKAKPNFTPGMAKQPHSILLIPAEGGISLVNV